jgi:hypothetical protein
MKAAPIAAITSDDTAAAAKLSDRLGSASSTAISAARMATNVASAMRWHNRLRSGESMAIRPLAN